MRYVLDTSAILSGKDIPTDNELYSSPKILDELKHGKMKRRLDFLMESGLRLISPSDKTKEEVKSAAQKTGDIARVSEADIEILSLAMELDAILLTDDYSLQNLASVLNVKYQGIAQKGITKNIKWRNRCTGCGRYWEKMHDSCPVCGSKLKTTMR
ncbi:MAG: nucleic acid-binding protein [Methanomassiliicoccales archaeon]|nr:MAG: nucleic acid-binding protein [Methanomassiliicoccales archaeon]